MIMLNGLHGNRLGGVTDDLFNLIPGVSSTVNTVTNDIKTFETVAIQYATVTLALSALTLLVGIATFAKVRK